MWSILNHLQGRRAAIERFGPVNTLINNAEIWRAGSIEDISEEVFRQAMRTNLHSVFSATQAAVPSIKKRGSGHIAKLRSTQATPPL